MEPAKLTALSFVNQDATPKAVTVLCDEASVADIMAWYGAFYAGDRYSVTADGVKVAKDQNGCPLNWGAAA